MTRSDNARLISAAHRETIDGLLVIHLAGSAYQMGYQHGTLCREEIRLFRWEAFAYMASLIAAVYHLPTRFARLVTRPLLLQQVRGYLPHTPPEFLDEMQGIADGAGVHLLEALLVNAVWEMYLAGGCSEFAVRGEKSADGKLIHGYNYDLADPSHAFINPYLALIFSRPDQGCAFAQVNTVGCVGVNAGMSAQGISVAWDNTHLRPGSRLLEGVPRRCTPFELVLRRLLQYASSIEEAVAIVRSHLPRPMADIIIIGDGKINRAVAMEMAGGSFALREMEEDAVWSANSFVSPSLGPEDRRGTPTADLDETGARLGRYAAYTELIGQSTQKVSLLRSVEILRDPYPRERAGYTYPASRQRTICRPVTSFSLVMQPAGGRIWVGDPKIPSPLGRYLGFDLSSESPLAEPAVPASGYTYALACCDLFRAERYHEAILAGERALQLDGAGVPIYLMLAKVSRAAGDEAAASRYQQQAGSLMAASGKETGNVRIPFPSAINPQVFLEYPQIDD